MFPRVNKHNARIEAVLSHQSMPLSFQFCYNEYSKGYLQDVSKSRKRVILLHMQTLLVRMILTS